MFASTWGVTATHKAGGKLTAAAGKFVAEVGRAAADDVGAAVDLARAFVASIVESGDLDRLPSTYAAERFARWHAAHTPEAVAARAKAEAVARRLRMHPNSSTAEIAAVASGYDKPKPRVSPFATQHDRDVWNAREKGKLGLTLNDREAAALAAEEALAASVELPRAATNGHAS